ncbi:MAG: putative DCC family thiol-disulfide oxidoreductase YuxK [Cyclobacteriaceae bacterium]|jgi:predicted DCC family thiol-disulfide oxidoreductase YuxK
MGADSQIDSTDKVVFYDGVCNFCNSSVKFIIKHERNDELKFAALQSNLAQKFLTQHNLKLIDFDGIIYIVGDKLCVKSRAAFEIAGFLNAPWHFISIFKYLPKFITDFFYDLIAKNRYKIFGRSDTCIIPSPEIRKRFLDQ